MTGFLTAISLLILAHSWYDPWCCNDKDCRPVPCEELVEQRDGTYRYQNYVVPRDKVKNSQDAQCHICIYNDQGRCAYIQMNT